MTFAEPGGLLVAVILAVSMLGAYIIYRMSYEGLEALEAVVQWLRGDRRGDER